MAIIIPVPIRLIPENQHLFYRIFKEKIQTYKVFPPAAFYPIQGGMSTIWEEYPGTAEEARSSAQGDPRNHAVLRMDVDAIRKIPEKNDILKLDAKHIPNEDSNAHAEVLPFPDDEESEDFADIQRQLARIPTNQWILFPDPMDLDKKYNKVGQLIQLQRKNKSNSIRI